jgi:predicted small secreted protein
VRLFRFALALPLAAALSLAACDDPTGFGRAVIVTDTLTLGVPSVAPDTMPSALDVFSRDQINVGGGRFPERPAEAEEWDVTLRLRNGQLQLLPRGALGLDSRRAGITAAVAGATFEGLREAPASARYATTEGQALAQGAVYVVRSRTVQGCSHYAKLQPLALDAAAGTARVAVATSASCSDTRLVRED